jgi:hypothetical protein
MDYQTIQLIKDFWQKWRSSRVLILFIVFIALFLDNMLLTTVGKLKKNKIKLNCLVFLCLSSYCS